MATLQTSERDALVRDHMGLAEKIARKKKRGLPRHIDLEDLISAAYLGLVESVNKFDPDSGVPFSGFAFRRVLGSIQDYLRKLGVGSRGDNSEGIRHMGQFDVNKQGQSGESFLMSEYRMGFDEITDGVSPLGKELLHLYYIDGLKLKQIGERIGVTEARVSQLLSQFRDQIRREAA